MDCKIYVPIYEYAYLSEVNTMDSKIALPYYEWYYLLYYL